MVYHIVNKDSFGIVSVCEPISTDAEEKLQMFAGVLANDLPERSDTSFLGAMNVAPMGLLDASTCYEDDEQNYYYIAVSTDKPTPENMVDLVVPECTWVIFASL